MKNLRITKIITALIIVIWAPSSFANPSSVKTSPVPLKITIRSGTTQVNLIYPSRIESCQKIGHDCKIFSSQAMEEAFWPHYTKDNAQSSDKLFRELSEVWEKKQSLSIASLESVLTFNLIGAMIRGSSSPQEVIPSIINVANLSMESDYLQKKYDMSTRLDFLNYLAKLRIVRHIAYYNNVVTSIHIQIVVEDKVIKDLNKALEKGAKAFFVRRNFL